MSQTTSIPQGPVRRTTALAIIGAICITAALSAALYGRVALPADNSVRQPLTVATTTYTPGNRYTRDVSYLGLVSAGEKAQLGFEVPGQIASIAVRQGSEVSAGDVIATLDDSALQARRRATSADLERVRSELELAELKSRRQQELSVTGAVSKEAYDETRLRAQALRAQVEATEARLEGIDIELRKSRLLAPYDGVIAERYAHPGTVVSPGVPVVRLLHSGPREAHVGVAASRAATLVPGQSYPLTLHGEALQAQLLSVRADVDPLTRSVIAIFVLPEDTNALDGEPVTLALREDVEARGGWLPMSALLEGRRGVWTVLRVEQRGAEWTTVREAVEVVDILGDRVYVQGTLPPGAIVVADGVHRVTAGNTIALAGH